MAKRLEIKGRRFGMLVAVEEVAKYQGKRRWRLQCDCGNERVALQKAFTSGGKMWSCGCAKRLGSHGLSEAPEYRHWINMISRCENPNTPSFENYGGRGISVCRRWRESFEAFLADMGKKPGAGYSIDRWPDNNGNYEPGNCRWATGQDQCRNLRTNRLVVVGGKEMTLAEAAEGAPVSYNTILYRLKRGWVVEDAVTRTQQRGRRP